jgi:hypothetical protein
MSKTKVSSLIDEVVYSPIMDEKMNSHVNDSEVWKKAYHHEELIDEVRNKFPRWYKYNVKFEGLKPIQVTKMEII